MRRHDVEVLRNFTERLQREGKLDDENPFMSVANIGPEDFTEEEAKAIVCHQVEAAIEALSKVKDIVEDQSWKAATGGIQFATLCLASAGSVLIGKLHDQDRTVYPFDEEDFHVPDFIPDDLRQQWENQFGSQTDGPSTTNESSNNESPTESPVPEDTGEHGGNPAEGSVQHSDDGSYRWKPNSDSE